MRRLKFGTAIKAIAATIIVSALLCVAGCTLVQPGCRNRDVKASIEKDARESLDLTSLSGLPKVAAATTISLVDQVEVSRHDDTRSCKANIKVGAGGEAVAVPIEYEVIADADGGGLYRWDKYGFGKKLIGTTLMSALLEMAHGRQALQQDEGTSDQSQPPPGTTNTLEPPGGKIPSPQGSSAPSNIMAAWKKQVWSEIAERAKKLIDMPKGRQRMSFRVGPGGEITMANAVEPVQNSALAERLVKFLEESDLVTKPPFNRVVWIQLTFAF